MARVDDYKNAAEIAKKELIPKNPKRIASMCGAHFDGSSADNISLELVFLNKKVHITWPDLNMFYKDSGKELPIQEQVLLLHYMRGCLNGAEVTGEWISYKDLPDGRFYMDAFVRRAKLPMLKAFGERPELLVKIAKELFNADEYDKGDYSVLIKALPYVPVVLIIWQGDEEFPPDGNILFDKGIEKIFSAEDIAWLSGMIVYPLAGKAKQEQLKS
ncbi:MAG: hypothetical protein DRG27_02160 [Deltaproteobacteria bacterium]|nr:MAG: hypothetical protein DRG27_02160 [Deltaproteobacteria bacterium]